MAPISGIASAEITRGSGNAQYNVSDGSGNVTDGGVIFQGEADIQFRNNTTDQVIPAAALRRNDQVGGETLSVPIPQDQPPGEYNNRAGFSVLVDAPSITEVEINNDDGQDVSGGTLGANQNATVNIEFNFEDSERIDLTIVSENGVDVTNEFTSANTTINASVANNVPEVDDTAGSVTIPIDPSNVDEGEYIFITEGDDYFDFGPATQTTTITVTAPQPQREIDVFPSDLPGDGTSSNPYEISNVSELQAMEHDLTANYTLITDIDASATAQWNSGSGFDPIGGESAQHITPPFSGSLNGNHHTITGITIDRSTEAGVGVIGVALSASVTNISFKKHTLTGRTQTGGVIGLSSASTVQNVTVSGDIDGSLGVGGVVGFARKQHRIQDVTISGSVSGESIVGGVVGNNNHSVIQDVTVSGEITGSDAVGGLVGRNNDGLIQNATSSGSISGGSSVGGGIGFNAADGTIQNATIFADANGQNGVGGVVGSNQGIIQNTTASGDLNGSTAVGGIVGFTDDTSKIQSATTFSNVTGVVFVGGSIGLSSGSTVRNLTALGSVAGNSRVGGVIGDQNDGTVRNAVTGTDLNGSIHVGGLIGVTENTTVQDVRSSGKTTGSVLTGGLIGESRHSIIQNATSSGDVNGSITVGGIVGNNADSLVQNATATGNINGTTTVGGVVGENNGTIRGARASGNVSGFVGVGGVAGENIGRGSIENATASGNITEEIDVGGGGFFGSAPPAFIEFNNTTVPTDSPTVTVDRAQFGNQSTPTGDFVVVVHQTDDGTFTGERGPKIGESFILSTETKSDILVNLSPLVSQNDTVTQLSNSQTLVAVLHRANRSGATNHGAPLIRNGSRVSDRAEITVNSTQVQPTETDTGTQNDGFGVFTAFVALLVTFLGFKRIHQE